MLWAARCVHVCRVSAVRFCAARNEQRNSATQQHTKNARKIRSIPLPSHVICVMLDRRACFVCRTYAERARVCVCALQNLLEQRTQTFFAAFRWRCVRSTLKCALLRSLCRSLCSFASVVASFHHRSVLPHLIAHTHTHTLRPRAVYVYNIFARRLSLCQRDCLRAHPPAFRRRLPFALAALRLLFRKHTDAHESNGRAATA